MTTAAMTIFPMTLIRSGGLPLSAWLPLGGGMPDWVALQKAEQNAAARLLNEFDKALLLLSDSPARTLLYNRRKDFYQRRKMPSPGIEDIVQTDTRLLQLLESLTVWQTAQQELQQSEAVFEQALSANYLALQAIAREETLLRAMLFASHDLLAGLSVFATNPLNQFGKKDRRTALSLLQYLNRAVFKTSPLGRFTTVQVHPIHSRKEKAPSQSFDIPKSMVTPNVALLPVFYEVFLREPAFYQSLSLRLNPCIVSAKLSTASWLYFDGEREAFQKIDPNPVAEFVVHTLLENRRTLPYVQLIGLLKNEVDATEAQLQSLVFQLIDIGLLEWQFPESGLSTSWCSGLYNYLGYLPFSPVLTDGAYLLQWLRTAARVFSFQGIGEAQTLQHETIQQIKTFLEKYGAEMPPIPPEQVFFEDVALEHSIHLPGESLENLTKQLAECWQKRVAHPLPPFRAQLLEFAQKVIPEGKSMDFLTFSRAFLEQKRSPKQASAESGVVPRYKGKVGALLQVYQENGTYKAVVNAMYPGGGKLLARWLPLFPASVSDQLKTWCYQETDSILAFPWQGWTNANFQPNFSPLALEVPDGRMAQGHHDRTILLAELAVRNTASGLPIMVEKHTNQPIQFNDLGLEAPDTKPPIMQILWHLGVPMVSADFLLPEKTIWESFGSIAYRKRIEYESLVLSRAAWDLSPEAWGRLFADGKSRAERIRLGVLRLNEWGVPRLFFGQFIGMRDKPQLFDLESPISMILLEKNLQRGSGTFRLTEMLPTPNQWLGERVMEFVLEFVAG